MRLLGGGVRGDRLAAEVALRLEVRGGEGKGARVVDGADEGRERRLRLNEKETRAAGRIGRRADRGRGSSGRSSPACLSTSLRILSMLSTRAPMVSADMRAATPTSKMRQLIVEETVISTLSAEVASSRSRLSVWILCETNFSNFQFRCVSRCTPPPARMTCLPLFCVTAE